MLYRAIATATGALMLAGCSVVGIRSGYDAPIYTVLDRIENDVEICSYPPRLAAEATVDADDEGSGRNQAFRILFDYISGANRSQSAVAMTVPVEVAPVAEKIAMTVPVETEAAKNGRITMRFFLPSNYTSATAPEPTDKRVEIIELPDTTQAVVRFSGLGGEAKINEHAAELREALDGSDWIAAGALATLFYDPPWTLPFLRRNEVVIPVERKDVPVDGGVEG